MKKLIDHANHHHGPIMAALLAQPVETIAAADPQAHAVAAPQLQMAEVTNLESAPVDSAAPGDVDLGAITPNAITIIEGTSGNDLLVGDANDNFIYGFAGDDV